MYTRWSKIVLVFSMAFDSILIVYNNLTDYGSNYLYVYHVMAMDTIHNNKCMWRSITHPFIHHAAYIFIIATELIVALLCGVGAYKLYRSRGNANLFNQEKKLAICGLSLGILLWFTGFYTIGGEWFLMWQSPTWNGQEAAFRLAAIFGIVMIYLIIPDHDHHP